ncbi:hypothetical protein A2W14_07125 [Candidatus Gottesmanbacteria bacterium RBG_16_37_8]|uniref:Glycosyl transferase family 1 domain-containing protein n=1 Tax=Candidatus Gottesmanbacteria bacterium RBG_16_37_8 TaxID=1798371 RepID=A0A1F5YWR6_9BACT|nr:MAG: hypothetical protein A2W14_07125 [Candidatus Gottesmanbacteria bacterium RBG_16_37_8]
MNFPKNDINVVYPGINSAFRNISPRMTKKIIGQYHISSPYFLTVGTKEPRKNIKRIINAFNKFIQQSYFKEIKNPPILVIAGNAGWGETITGDKRIKVIGKIDSQDLPALYSASISLVYPSLYEGFGLPVLEAFACGAPVICSNRGSLKEVAQDAAYIVDPVKEDDIAQAMLKIFTDRSLRDKLINKGLTRSKFFSWDNAVRGVLSSYNQLLNK